MKEKLKAKKILLIGIGVLVALAITALVLVLVLKNKDAQNDQNGYLKKDVYTQKLDDLGNPSKDIGIMLLDCDSLEPFSDIQNAKVATRAGKYVQGTGAFSNMKFQNNLLSGAMKQAIDISKYEKGSIHISLYVEDKGCLTDGINFELASNGVCDSDELQWIIPLSKLNEGWNEYYLSIEGAMRSGKPDLSNINFFRAYTINPSMGVTVILDNVYATDTEGVAYEPDPVPLREVVKDGYKETQTDQGKMLMSGNTVNVFQALEYVEVTTQKDEFIEGTGAFKTVGLQDLLIAGVFAEPVDLSEYKDGLVHISLYINDVSLLKQAIFFELTSSGTWDADEYNWEITLDQLKNGWNELYLPFANSVITGKPDIKKIDFVRFFTIGQEEDLVTIFDNVYATNQGAKDSGKETTSPHGEMIMSGNTINIFRWLNYVEVSNKKNEFVEGTGAFKTVGHQNLLLEGVFSQPKNIEAYKDGSVHVSLYINDIKLLKDSIYLELTSSGTWDKDEYNWEIQASQLKNGWNELYLPFKNAAVTGKPNLKALDFVRFFTTKQEKGLVTIFDNVYATNKKVDNNSTVTPPNTNQNTVSVDTKSPYGQMIASGNKKDVFSFLGFVEQTTKKGEYVEGSGAFKTIGKENLLIEAVLANAVDLSKYKDGFVHISFYISDKTCLKEDIFFEMTSSGVCDVDEYNWSISATQLQDGWNELYLPFAKATVTGSPNLKKINFFRAFTLNRKQGVITIFDNIYATYSQYNESEIACDQHMKAGDILLADCLCYFKDYDNMKLSVDSQEGAYALKAKDSTKAMNGVFAKAVNIQDYKKGYIHISLYVNNVDYVNRGIQFVLSSSGKASANSYEWSIEKEQLVSGWNELWLPIGDAAKKGSPDLSSINFFQVKATESNRKLSFSIDDVRATKTR